MYSKHIEPKFKSILLFLIIFCGIQTVIAQEIFGKKCFGAPGVSLGYTFHAGINYGIVLDAGIINNKNVNSLRYGLSFSYYFVTIKVKGEGHVHRLRATYVMLGNNIFDAKLGVGRARNRWGYGEKNRCIVRGLSADISFAYPNIYSPWVGIKTFQYNRFNWAWFTKPYNSVYMKYKYDVIPNQSKVFGIEN